jgi:predicted esterase
MLIQFFAATIAAIPCVVLHSAEPSITQTATSPVDYSIKVGSYDWGPSVDRLVLRFNEAVKGPLPAAKAFSVEAVQRKPGNERGARTVAEAYFSDARGERVKEQFSPWITLALETGPGTPAASIFSWDSRVWLNRMVSIDHRITLPALSLASGGSIPAMILAPEANTGTSYPGIEAFDRSGIADYDDEEYGKVTLRYASYAPPANGAKHPLIVWLHGAGEGGTDPLLPLLGANLARLVAPDIQGIFGGAYVLVPQSPVVWMFNGRSQYPFDGSTIYAGALKALIDRFLVANPSVDPRRIYLGGCSNGGYMTIKMVLEFPDFFAAGWPVCEAYQDQWISQKDLAVLARTPLWFTQAKTDQAVEAEYGGYVLDTFQRLKAAGATRVFLNNWDRVEDLSGRWFKKDGKTPWEYNGHFSWIYALDNRCRQNIAGKSVSLMEWLAAQKL